MTDNAISVDCGGAMRELVPEEVEQVGGGIGPLAIVGMDLALTAVMLGYAAWASNNYYHQQE